MRLHPRNTGSKVQEVVMRVSTNTLGEVLSEPQSPGYVAQKGGVLDPIIAHWNAMPQWKKQAVIGGAVGAMTFFWVTRLNRFVFD